MQQTDRNRTDRMRDKSGMARPWLFRGIRLAEAIGLLALLYGLASSGWLIAVAGAAIILTAYKLHRRHFPIVERDTAGSMGLSDGGD
jgi:hypothetical protein